MICVTVAMMFQPLKAWILMGRESALPEVQLLPLPEGDLGGHTIRSALRKLNLIGKRIGVTQDLPAALVLMLQNNLSAQVFDMNQTIFDMRAVKDADELALMRQGAVITDRVYNTLCTDIVRLPRQTVQRVSAPCLLTYFGIIKSR